MRLMMKIHNAAHEEIPRCGSRGSSNMRLTMKFQDAAHEEVPRCGSRGSSNMRLTMKIHNAANDEDINFQNARRFCTRYRPSSDSLDVGIFTADFARITAPAAIR